MGAASKTRRRPLWLSFLVIAILGLTEGAQAQQIGSKRDRLLPIEIEADNLEVQQDRQLAIFAGNVSAIQGSLQLQAETLKVHYLVGPARASDGQAIERIDAIGQVFFSSETETAEGDEGVYDVDAGIITLTGDVILRRGESVITGRRVVLNLETGLSTVQSGTEPGGGKGRVRGLFVPNQSKDQ